MSNINKANKNPIMRGDNLIIVARLFSPLLACLMLTALAQPSRADVWQKKSQTKKPSPDKKAASDYKPSPQMAIDGTRHDFGEVFIGETLEHVFVVRNLGVSPLELSQGGPVAALEGQPAHSFIRAVSFTDSDRAWVSGLPSPAMMRAAPS